MLITPLNALHEESEQLNSNEEPLRPSIWVKLLFAVYLKFFLMTIFFFENICKIAECKALSTADIADFGTNTVYTHLHFSFCFSLCSSIELTVKNLQKLLSKLVNEISYQRQ